MEIKKVVVIGSGTMGSGIAAHLCNANIPVTLLDLKTEISEQARDKIHKSRPPLLLDKSKINNIKVGNILDNFDEVVVVLFLAGLDNTTIPIQMWVGLREQLSPTIMAVATCLIIMSTLILLTAELLRRRSERLRGINR